MSKVKSIFKPGALREMALRTIKKLSTEIKIRGLNQKKFRFVNTTQEFLSKSELDFLKRQNKVIKKSTEFSSAYITGRSKESLKYMRENFVPVGMSFNQQTSAQRAALFPKIVGKHNIRELKKAKQLRQQLGKQFAIKEAGVDKMARRSAFKKIMDPAYGFNPKAKELASKRYNAERRIEARAKGIRFIRKNGRIIPIRGKK